MEDGACPERLETPGGWAGIAGSVCQFGEAVNTVYGRSIGCEGKILHFLSYELFRIASKRRLLNLGCDCLRLLGDARLE
jgi:hypothetical protein